VEGEEPGVDVVRKGRAGWWRNGHGLGSSGGGTRPASIPLSPQDGPGERGF
jgi:hypothetical protein